MRENEIRYIERLVGRFLVIEDLCIYSISLVEKIGFCECIIILWLERDWSDNSELQCSRYFKNKYIDDQYFICTNITEMSERLGFNENRICRALKELEIKLLIITREINNEQYYAINYDEVNNLDVEGLHVIPSSVVIPDPNTQIRFIKHYSIKVEDRCRFSPALAKSIGLTDSIVLLNLGNYKLGLHERVIRNTLKKLEKKHLITKDINNSKYYTINYDEVGNLKIKGIDVAIA